MDWLGSPWIWAQTTGVGSPAAAAYLALRRWCGGLTLSPSQPAPDWQALWVVAVGPLLLAVLSVLAQGPSTAFRQLFDFLGHLRLLREAGLRVWRAGGMVAILLTLTVFSWTSAQCFGYFFDDGQRGMSDLMALRRGRTPTELVVEHAVTAAPTPLRDVAGLGDSLPILTAALVVLLSAGRLGTVPVGFSPGTYSQDQEHVSNWRGLVGLCAGMYFLYRLFCRFGGGGELPIGNCLLIEVALIPGLMLVCDGFLLAWLLVEIRDGELDDDTHPRLNPSRALQLMPAASLGCLAALPGRYAATALVLVSQHLPASWMAAGPGRALRWGLGPGLVWFQTFSLAAMFVVGVIAWSGGGLREIPLGVGRTLRREGGRLTALAITAALACGGLSALPYILLPALSPAGWVLPAVDAYAHYATFPVGLWTLAACIVLAERALPVARLADVEPASEIAEPESQAAPAASAD
jgi:hypothetical protein